LKNICHSVIYIIIYNIHTPTTTGALSTPCLYPVDHDVSQGVSPPSPTPLLVHGTAAVGTSVLSGPHHQPAIDNTLILP